MWAIALAGLATDQHESRHEQEAKSKYPVIPFFHSANRFYFYDGECSQNAALTRIIF